MLHDVDIKLTAQRENSIGLSVSRIVISTVVFVVYTARSRSGCHQCHRPFRHGKSTTSMQWWLVSPAVVADHAPTMSAFRPCTPAEVRCIIMMSPVKSSIWLPASLWCPCVPPPIIQVTDVCCTTHMQHLWWSMFWCCWTAGVKLFADWTATMRLTWTI